MFVSKWHFHCCSFKSQRTDETTLNCLRRWTLDGTDVTVMSDTWTWNRRAGIFLCQSRGTADTQYCRRCSTFKILYFKKYLEQQKHLGCRVSDVSSWLWVPAFDNIALSKRNKIRRDFTCSCSSCLICFCCTILPHPDMLDTRKEETNRENKKTEKHLPFFTTRWHKHCHQYAHSLQWSNWRTNTSHHAGR